uniref:NGN domain-containing protein n=1 Tax=Glossina pallidipes TaxID=7398 RepID=A0A1A9ZIU7_GLOPL
MLERVRECGRTPQRFYRASASFTRKKLQVDDCGDLRDTTIPSVIVHGNRQSAIESLPPKLTGTTVPGKLRGRGYIVLEQPYLNTSDGLGNPYLLALINDEVTVIDSKVVSYVGSLDIKAVVAAEGVKGYIYVESYKQTHVKTAIENVGNLRMGQWKQEMVPITEMMF